MPAPFRQLTFEEFCEVLDRFPFTRRVNAVHMHHTWRPNHAQYRGHDSIKAMWQFHTQHNNWSDIAQHITIAPDGSIWTGRDWNKAPASASGHNGNSQAGPFMFEMIGDFDIGRDPWGGAQKETALGVVARVQRKFGLRPESLRFHNQMGPKTCPGSQIDYDATLEEVRALHEEEPEGPLPQVVREPVRFPGVILEARLGFDESVREALDALQGLGARATAAAMEPGDAEPAETEMPIEDIVVYSGQENAVMPAPSASRGPSKNEFTAAVRSAMRPYVVNLDRGRFSSEGLYASTAEDVDAIFGTEMERAAEEAKQAGRKLRVMFYAHGGLVGEGDGLWMAHLASPWWRQNNVYPVYFVWETGLLPQLKQVLFGPRPAVAPRGFIEETFDKGVEVAARKLRLPMDIWTNMKRSAAASVLEGGGALHAARRLKEFCDRHEDDVELHAVGHSAGSIFHSHFIPTALDLGVPAFRTVSFLAPAIRVDAFHKRLAPRLGNGIESMTLYTMSKDWELEDSCMGIYKKSLLYLIRNALEPADEDAVSGKAARPTPGIPILGLEESLRSDDKLRRIFGLSGQPGTNGEVVWSVSMAGGGTRASGSRTHGGFDNDRLTMHGVAARVLGIDDTAQVRPLPQALVEASSRSLDSAQSDELLEGAEFFAQFVAPPAEPLPFSQPGTLPHPAPIVLPAAAPAVSGARPSGRRSALCIGIDRYASAPLSGCVADARLWSRTLDNLGFQVELVTDAQATREGIVSRLRDLIQRSSAGDVLVFQYAGHGTSLVDLDADEPDGKDEALCPFDLDSGAFLIDDDLAEIWDLIPAGVNMTCFMDCCHSGTINRVVGGTQHPAGNGTRKPRYLIPTAEMQEAHVGYRREAAPSPAGRSRGPAVMREVSFSACLAREVAWENDGQGDFTRRATKVLVDGGARRRSNAQFHQEVLDAFGAGRAQTPELNCSDALRGAWFLEP